MEFGIAARDAGVATPAIPQGTFVVPNVALLLASSVARAEPFRREALSFIIVGLMLAVSAVVTIIPRPEIKRDRRCVEVVVVVRNRHSTLRINELQAPGEYPATRPENFDLAPCAIRNTPKDIYLGAAPHS